jgi:hypothetical protein
MSAVWWLSLAGCLVNSSLRDERHREIDACLSPELCNGRDDDCDRLVDDEDPDLDWTSAPAWHADEDGDGFGNPYASTRQCEAPVFYVSDDTDCDDSDPSARPGEGREDLPYDGVDLDCDHHNDFDVDGDCFMPPGFESAYLAYARRLYGAEPPPFCVDPELPFGDCLDEPSSLPISPELVHPSTEASPNPEIPYDGLDSDCAGDNDYDADSDGFMASELVDVAELLEAYVAAWGYEDRVSSWASANPDADLSAPAEGDCDDTDAERWPGALEQVGDGEDDDCAGDGDASAFTFGDGAGPYLFQGLSEPEVSRLGDSYLVLVAARSGELPSPSENYGLALPFSADARGGASPAAPLLWLAGTSSLLLQPRLDVALEAAPADTDADGLPDPVLWVASVRDNDFVDYSYLGAHSLTFLTGTSTLRLGPSTSSFVTAMYTAAGLDLAPGSAGPFALACGSDRLHAIAGLLGESDTLVVEGAESCFFVGPPAASGDSVDFALCGGGSCTDWTLTDAVDFVEGEPRPDGWSLGDLDEGWLSLLDEEGRGWVQPVSGLAEPLPVEGRLISLDVAEADGILYAAAIEADGGTRTLWLVHGPPGALVGLELPLQSATLGELEPERVGIFADTDRVVLAVTAEADEGEVVGWTFMGP